MGGVASKVVGDVTAVFTGSRGVGQFPGDVAVNGLWTFSVPKSNVDSAGDGSFHQSHGDEVAPTAEQKTIWGLLQRIFDFSDGHVMFDCGQYAQQKAAADIPGIPNLSVKTALLMSVKFPKLMKYTELGQDIADAQSRDDISNIITKMVTQPWLFNIPGGLFIQSYVKVKGKDVWGKLFPLFRKLDGLNEDDSEFKSTTMVWKKENIGIVSWLQLQGLMMSGLQDEDWSKWNKKVKNSAEDKYHIPWQILNSYISSENLDDDMQFKVGDTIINLDKGIMCRRTQIYDALASIMRSNQILGGDVDKDFPAACALRFKVFADFGNGGTATQDLAGDTARYYGIDDIDSAGHNFTVKVTSTDPKERDKIVTFLLALANDGMTIPIRMDKFKKGIVANEMNVYVQIFFIAFNGGYNVDLQSNSGTSTKVHDSGFKVKLNFKGENLKADALSIYAIDWRTTVDNASSSCADESCASVTCSDGIPLINMAGTCATTIRSLFGSKSEILDRLVRNYQDSTAQAMSRSFTTIHSIEDIITSIQSSSLWHNPAFKAKQEALIAFSSQLESINGIITAVKSQLPQVSSRNGETIAKFLCSQSKTVDQIVEYTNAIQGAYKAILKIFQTLKGVIDDPVVDKLISEAGADGDGNLTNFDLKAALTSTEEGLRALEESMNAQSSSAAVASGGVTDNPPGSDSDPQFQTTTNNDDSSEPDKPALPKWSEYLMGAVAGLVVIGVIIYLIKRKHKSS